MNLHTTLLNLDKKKQQQNNYKNSPKSNSSDGHQMVSIKFNSTQIL
jgi:hypothetical protein